MSDLEQVTETYVFSTIKTLYRGKKPEKFLGGQMVLWFLIWNSWHMGSLFPGLIVHRSETFLRKDLPGCGFYGEKPCGLVKKTENLARSLDVK